MVHKWKSLEKYRLTLSTFEIKPDGTKEKINDQNNTVLAHNGMAKAISKEWIFHFQ